MIIESPLLDTESFQQRMYRCVLRFSVFFCVFIIIFNAQVVITLFYSNSTMPQRLCQLFPPFCPFSFFRRYNNYTGVSQYEDPNNPWAEATDEQGNVYYYNYSTGVSQYENPYATTTISY